MCRLFVLSHEAIIDWSGQSNLRELLLERFPHATKMNCARRMVCVRGAIIQDMDITRMEAISSAI